MDHIKTDLISPSYLEHFPFDFDLPVVDAVQSRQGLQVIAHVGPAKKTNHPNQCENVMKKKIHQPAVLPITEQDADMDFPLQGGYKASNKFRTLT